MKNQPVTNTVNDDVNGSPKANGSADGVDNAKASGIATLIAETEALRTLLREAHNQTSRLLVHIKRHKKQAHAVQATLASLRQLQHIET